MALTGRGLILPQVLRYAVVGCFSNLCAYAAYLVITQIGAAPKVAMTIVYGIAAAIGFFSNRKITFAYQGNSLNAALKYAMAYGAGYLLNFCILWFFVDRAGYPHRYVQAAAIFAVAAFLFLLQKFYVFRDRV